MRNYGLDERMILEIQYHNMALRVIGEEASRISLYLVGREVDSAYSEIKLGFEKIMHNMIRETRTSGQNYSNYGERIFVV